MHNVVIFANNNFFFSDNEKIAIKSCEIFELIAFNNESAVDVVAAISPMIASMKKEVLPYSRIKERNGVPVVVQPYCFAAIPNNKGIHEKQTMTILAIIAPFFAEIIFFVAKKRWAISCSINENSRGVRKLGKRVNNEFSLNGKKFCEVHKKERNKGIFNEKYNSRKRNKEIIKVTWILSMIMIEVSPPIIVYRTNSIQNSIKINSEFICMLMNNVLSAIICAINIPDKLIIEIIEAMYFNVGDA